MVDGLCDVVGVGDWVVQVLCYGGGWIDVVLLLLVLCGGDVQVFGDEVCVMVGCVECLIEMMDQGCVFVVIVLVMGYDMFFLFLLVVVGLVVCGFDLLVVEVIVYYLYVFVVNLIFVVMCFLFLGQVQVQVMLVGLYGVIVDIVV